jgi:8-amino-7-oxononanoate synthase
MSLDDRLNRSLHYQQKANLYRKRLLRSHTQTPIIEIEKQSYLNFCGNDYLGLANHPEIISAAQLAIQKYGAGSGASTLVSGYTEIHKELEESLAEFTDRSRVLLFSSGFAANTGIIPALVKKKDELLMDRLCHASLIDGAKLSAAKIQRYRHLDLDNLQQLFAEDQADQPNQTDQIPWVITESLFSMDGDQVDLKKMAKLCRDQQAALYVDDAHGFGIFGENGAGCVAAARLTEQDVPILVGTFGKAFGVSGAFVAGSEPLIEFLIQHARSYIYSTAPPPALAAAILKSLQLIKKEHWRREKLFELIATFREQAIARGLPLSVHADGPIQPLFVGDTAKALALSAVLKESQLLITAIRPPTVPKETARLRITLSAAHDQEHIDQLVDKLSRYYEEE